MNKAVSFISGVIFAILAIAIFWAEPGNCRNGHLIATSEGGPGAPDRPIKIFFHDQLVWHGRTGVTISHDFPFDRAEGNITVYINDSLLMRGGYVFPFDGLTHVISVHDQNIVYGTLDRGLLELVHDYISCIGA